MPNYRRAYVPGGTYFFTVVTQLRQEILCGELARRLLRDAIQSCLARYPFNLEAIVLLPDHLHAIWTLPEDDMDYSKRWAVIKKDFAKDFVAQGGHANRVTTAQREDRRLGVWQPKFWEHRIKDQRDYERHFDYVHYNPVKHGLAKCPHEWKHSSFRKHVERSIYDSAWCCSCEDVRREVPDFTGLAGSAME